VNRMTWLIPGLALGLYLARIIAEVTRALWSPVALVVCAIALCATCVWLARWLDRRKGQTRWVAMTRLGARSGDRREALDAVWPTDRLAARRRGDRVADLRRRWASSR